MRALGMCSIIYTCYKVNILPLPVEPQMTFSFIGNNYLTVSFVAFSKGCFKIEAAIGREEKCVIYIYLNYNF